MEKLKTLQTFAWNSIDAQAEKIHWHVSKQQEQGCTRAKVKGCIHKVNKAILETNGFRVHEHVLDYITGESYFEVSWS